MGRPAHRATTQIQPKPELRQQAQLPADVVGGPGGVGLDRREQVSERLVDGRRRLSLRQRGLGQRASGGNSRQPRTIRQHRRRQNSIRLAAHRAELIRQPRPPAGADLVAGLQHAARSPAGTAAHEPRMPAMAARKQRQHHGGLAERAGREYDSFVAPLHRRRVSQAGNTRQSAPALVRVRDY